MQNKFSQFFIFYIRGFVGQFQIFMHGADSNTGQNLSGEPIEHADNRQNNQKHEPQPKKNENFLCEHVDY